VGGASRGLLISDSEDSLNSSCTLECFAVPLPALFIIYKQIGGPFVADEISAKKRRMLDNVPSDVLIAVAKTFSHHSKEKLYQDQETRIVEVLRVCDSETIDRLVAEFPTPCALVAWLFVAEASISQRQVSDAIKEEVPTALFLGIQPKLQEAPSIYRVDSLGSNTMFRCVASDRNQQLPIAFGQSESVKVLSYYDALLHFSKLQAIVFGPYSALKAAAVLSTVDGLLGIDSQWSLLKHGIGQSRKFYNALKKKMDALLIETKRHDPSGDYRSVALEARDKNPDLEGVPSFKKQYLDAESEFDVLRFRCKNSLGLMESVHVKFGRPFGRFAFGPNPSTSALRFFQSQVSELLRES
jgi:hypothetical protein